MDRDFRNLTDFLIGIGVEGISHTNKTYLAHLIGVYRLMSDQGCTEELCRAGMFHSVYGTELFGRFALPLERRPEVRALIGDRAERLAYLNCAMDRSSFDAAVARAEEPYRFRDRFTGQEVELDQTDFDDLCRVHLYDWLEQVPRSKWWEYRRAAYRQTAARLGGVAQEAHDRAFAGESAGAEA
jgi:hypothetical protein